MTTDIQKIAEAYLPSFASGQQAKSPNPSLASKTTPEIWERFTTWYNQLPAGLRNPASEATLLRGFAAGFADAQDLAAQDAAGADL